MGLLDMIAKGKMMNRKARLLTDIETDDGEERKAGSIVNVLIDKGRGNYHIEDNDFACTVSSKEIEFI